MPHNEFRIKVPLHIKSSSNLGVLGSSFNAPTSTAYLSLDSFAVVFGWHVLGQLAFILHGEACRRSAKACIRPIDASQGVSENCATPTQTYTVNDEAASYTHPAPEKAFTGDNEADVTPDISHFFIFHGNRTRRVLSAPAGQTRRKDSPKRTANRPMCSQSRPVSSSNNLSVPNTIQQHLAVAQSGCTASRTTGKGESLNVSLATEHPYLVKGSKEHASDRRSRSAKLMELMCSSVAGPIRPDAGQPALITDELRLEVATAWNVPALYGTSSFEAEEATESVDLEVEALDHQSQRVRTLAVSIPNSSARSVLIVPQCTPRGRLEIPAGCRPAAAACTPRTQHKPASAGINHVSRAATPPRCKSARAGHTGIYGSHRGSWSHHDGPQQPEVQGGRSSSPIEVFAEQRRDDTVRIVAKNATSLAASDLKRRTSLLRSFKSVAESLFERLQMSGGTGGKNELDTGLPVADGRHTRSRSPAQGEQAHRCQSARPCTISSAIDYSVKAAARMRPHTASHINSSQRLSSPHGRAAVRRRHSADGYSQETWELRAKRRMRVNTLVQSVASENELAEVGKLSQEQMRRFWDTNSSADSPGLLSLGAIPWGCGPRRKRESALPAVQAEAASATKYPEHPVNFTLANEQQQTPRKGVHRPLRKYRNPDLWLLDATTASLTTALRVDIGTRLQLDLEIGTKRPQAPLVPKHKSPSRQLHRRYSSLCRHNTLPTKTIDTQLQQHRSSARGPNECGLATCTASSPLASRPSSAHAPRSLERLSMLQSRRQQRSHALKSAHQDP